LGNGKGGGEVDLFFKDEEFIVDVEAGDAVGLEFTEFVLGAVGAAFLEGAEFGEALHLEEEDLVGGFV